MSSGIAPTRRGSTPSFISSAVRCITRPTPFSPTGRWCASSGGMNCAERARGSTPAPGSARGGVGGEERRGGVAGVIAEVDLPLGLGLGEEDAPAVLGHLDVAEVGPAALAHADGRAEVDVVVLEIARARLHPPLDVPGLPV